MAEPKLHAVDEKFLARRKMDFGSEGGWDGMEARLAKLEAGMEYLTGTQGDIKSELRHLNSKVDSNFKWTVGIYLSGILAMLGAFGSLAVLIAKGFKWF